MSAIKIYKAVVVMNHGQFYLYSQLENFNVIDLIDEAQKGENIAGDDEMILCLVPHQHNYAMSLQVEYWNKKPPSDMENWDEVFEAHIRIVNDTLVYQSAEDDGCVFTIPNGYYKVLISGRGFINQGWTESQEPGDNWRIQLWPNRNSVCYRRLKKWIFKDQNAIN